MASDETIKLLKLTQKLAETDRQLAITTKIKDFTRAHIEGGAPMAMNRTFDAAVRQMRDGQRKSEWHYHILPSVIDPQPGLFDGEPPNDVSAYRINSFDEALAFVQDDVLGFNLGYILTVILDQVPSHVDQPNALMRTMRASEQLHSCVTLFDFVLRTCGHEPDKDAQMVCQKILIKYFGAGHFLHPETQSILERWHAQGS